MQKLRIDYRRLVIIFAVALFLSSADRSCATLRAGEPNQVQLYFFTNEGCRPCKQVEPVLRALAERGYPIMKVDTTVYPKWVAQFGVASTPTVVLVKDNKEIARHSGFIDSATLERWFANAGANLTKPSVGNSIGTQDNDEFVKSINANRNADKFDGDTSTLHEGTRIPANQIEKLAINASVRLRVEDPEGISYATGTVIHCHNGEWLVLTCGHVFRDADGKGVITAEYDFTNDEPKTAPGRLISYDSEARDIGLVVVQAGVDIQPIPVALKTTSVIRGNAVFTIGCDHGQSPTIRRTRIKNKAAYDGVIKYDIYGRPVDGRSGGGMFTDDGRLIGVCNAASVDFDEGIYTALDTIYWQLAKVDLTHLFEEAAKNSLVQNESPTGRQPPREFDGQRSGSSNPIAQQAVPSADLIPATVMERVKPEGRMPADRMAVASHQGSAENPRVAVRPREDFGRRPGEQFADGRPFQHVNWQRPDGSATADVPENDMEVILIVRSKHDPTRAEAITLADPSPQLLKYLEKLGNRQAGKSRINMAQLRHQIGPGGQQIR